MVLDYFIASPLYVFHMISLDLLSLGGTACQYCLSTSNAYKAASSSSYNSHLSKICFYLAPLGFTRDSERSVVSCTVVTFSPATLRSLPVRSSAKAASVPRMICYFSSTASLISCSSTWSFLILPLFYKTSCSVKAALDPPSCWPCL